MKRLAAIALTLAVSALTPAVAADQVQAPAPAAAEPAPAQPAGTRLPVRPSRPLDLAPQPRSSRLGFSLLLLAGALGAGLWAWRRRGGLRSPAPERAITITARAAVGVRSELLVVEVAGQRLLLGVTPAGIQRLSVLTDPEGAVESALGEADVEPGFTLPEPAPPARVAAPRPAPARATRVGREGAALEEQVRGLLRARRGA